MFLLRLYYWLLNLSLNCYYFFIITWHFTLEVLFFILICDSSHLLFSDQSLNMHRFLIVGSIIAFYSMVILNTVSGGQTDVVHICCYSTDPGSYTPTCYDCNNSVYKNALMACLNMTDLPKNISFKAATCMEKNCQLQIPQTSEAETLKKDPFMLLLQNILQAYTNPTRRKRSVSGDNGRHVVKEVSTLVAPPEEPTINFIETDYM